jgi:hypothetical protein
MFGKEKNSSKEEQKNGKKVDLTMPVQVYARTWHGGYDWVDAVVTLDGELVDVKGGGCYSTSDLVGTSKIRNAPESTIEEIDNWYNEQISFLETIRQEKIAAFNERWKEVQYDGKSKKS